MPQTARERIESFFIRLRIDQPILTAVPEFKITLLILILLGIGGLVYGHIINAGPQAKSLSLLLSAAGWLGTIFFILLENFFVRLKYLLLQTLCFTLLTIFGLAITALYSSSVLVENPVISVQIALLFAALLLGYLVIRLFRFTFTAVRIPEEKPYPGLRTAPFLFFLLAINYLWWNWDSILIYFK